MGLTCDSGEPGGVKWPLLTHKLLKMSLCLKLFPALTQTHKWSLSLSQAQTQQPSRRPKTQNRTLSATFTALNGSWMAVQVVAGTLMRPGLSNEEADRRTWHATFWKQYTQEFHLFIFHSWDSAHISDPLRQHNEVPLSQGLPFNAYITAGKYLKATLNTSVSCYHSPSPTLHPIQTLLLWSSDHVKPIALHIQY